MEEIMFTLSTSIAWLVFAFLTTMAYVTVYTLCPATRKPQAIMMICGLFGGIIAAMIHGTDFWRPNHVLVGIPIEEMLFGGGFLGLVTALTLVTGTEFTVPEIQQTVPRRRKVYLLSTMVIVCLGLWGMGTNSVLAMAVMLAIGAVFLAGQRPDLQPLVWRGMLVSLTVFALLVCGFVFLIAGNADELGRAFSPYYASRGWFRTAFDLGLWSAAFGAFFGPFYLWWRNLEFC